MPCVRCSSADAPILATDADGIVTLQRRRSRVAHLAGGPADRPPHPEVFIQTEVLRLHDLAVGGEAGQAEVRMPGAGKNADRRGVSSPVAQGVR